ncbi:MAG: c-type cytochrome [Anaerolineales bacterium]|nr:c-type cytochrome [Anaerolineales bacterium]
MKWYIALGLGSIVVLTAVLGVIALNEPARMEEFTEAFQARQVENGAALFDNNCRSCHGPQGRGISGVAPSLVRPELFNGSYLDEIGFAGTTEDFVRATIAGGRPVPSQGTNYPQRMPTWSEEFGGPLKEYQVEELVAYVMNWEEEALAQAEPTPSVPEGEAVGTDITVELPEGDPERGEELASGNLGCAGCHILSATGPAWEGGPEQPGIGARAEQRIQQDNYTGEAESAEQYLVESIIRTDAHVVEGFEAGIMPGTYGQRLSTQDLADLVAYLDTLR